MSYYRVFAVALLSVFLSACGGQTAPDPEPTEMTYPDDADAGANTSGANDGSMGAGEEFGYDDEVLGTVIYFEFNSSEVRAQDQDLVAAHAIQLNDNGFTSVRLEGHADERGSREYNIGLGERRAQAVRQMLMIQGVDASQIQTVSFGEERPDVMGSSESDYAQNRRVEMKTSN
jgi:peptidoglycan-associated lipoprotein